MAGEHKTEDYLKKNPKGQIPTLTDGDLTIIESVSAARYVCAKGGDKGASLYPIEDHRDKARINEALSALNDYRTAQGALAMAKFWGPIRKMPLPPQGLIDQVEHRFKEENSKLDAMLAGKKYLVLDRLTLADFAFVEFWINGQVVGYDFKSQYPNTWTYINGIIDEIPKMRVESFEFFN
jgi:glutathione S-transferase